MPRKKILLTTVAILTLALVCLAKTKKLSGKMVAYDFMKHSAKSASLVQNEEVVVLETPNEKQKYVKLVFSSSGTTQIDPQYFDGSQPLAADVLRVRRGNRLSQFVPFHPINAHRRSCFRQRLRRAELRSVLPCPQPAAVEFPVHGHGITLPSGRLG